MYVVWVITISGRGSDNPIVRGTLRIWTQFRKHFGLMQALVSMPFIANPLFRPSLLDAAFQTWFGKGLHCVGDLFINGLFGSFDQFVKEYNLPKSHFFRYLQIRNFTRTYFPSFPHKPPACPLDECLKLKPRIPGCVSQLYSILQDMEGNSLHHLKERWGEDLSMELSEETWQRAIKRVHTSSICVRHGLVQFKILNRLHLCGVRLALIYPGSDPNCIRCHQAPATLGHMFWTCSKLHTFWSEIFKTFSYICIKKRIEPDPVISVFGVTPSNSRLSKHHSDFIAFSTLLARRLILFGWKSATPPSHSRWVCEVMAFLKLEKIRCTIQGSVERFKKTWCNFLEYFISEFDATTLDQ